MAQRMGFQKLKHYNASIRDWKDFVHQPMHLVDVKQPWRNQLCQKGYPFGTISPCVSTTLYKPISMRTLPISRYLPASVNDPIYELQFNRTPYDHPLQLRAAKIQNMLNLDQRWELGGFGWIRYEDLVGQGLAKVIQQLSANTGHEAKCQQTPFPFMPKPPYNLPIDFQNWITEHTDWFADARIGYSSVK